jgi:hypothetical protein
MAAVLGRVEKLMSKDYYDPSPMPLTKNSVSDSPAEKNTTQGGYCTTQHVCHWGYTVYPICLPC